MFRNTVKSITFVLVVIGLLGILAAYTPAAITELFISEYIEGSSYNKAIEIYNGTGAAVSLSTYKLEIYYNGSTSPTTITLSGTVANGDVYVVAHSSANSTILAQADLKTSSLSFNGDDAVVLKKSTTVVDAIGQVGYDPGTEWGSGYTSTCDNTLVRKSTITAGDTNPNDTFTPSLQWDGYAVDTFTYLGSHTVGGATPTPTSTPTPTPLVTPTPTPTPTGGVTYNYYFGQLHSHTSYSDGTGTPNDAYVYARNTGLADFFAVTDHSNWFDNDLDWTKSVEWANLKAAANSNNVDGQFVALAAFEMTWSNSSWGHMNTFNTDWFESRNNSNMTLPNFYNRIAADTTSISQWNHPGTTFGDFEAFNYFSTANDNVIGLIEVANGSGSVRGSGYYPSYEYYWKALDKGWHVAPTIGQDNHSANWVTANTARAVVLASSLTRANVLDAMRNNRVYATEDKNLKLMYTANGAVMGSVLNQPSTLNIVIDVNDPDTADTVSKIEIISTGGIVVTSKTFSSNVVNWTFQLSATNKYYYVRVTMANGDYAFSAPIWTGL